MRVPGAAGWRQALAPSANRCRAARRDTPRASAMWFQDLPRARADDVPDVCLSGAVPSPWLADPHLDNIACLSGPLEAPPRQKRRSAPMGMATRRPELRHPDLAPRPCPNLLDRLAGPRSWGSITNDLSIRVPARGTRRSVGAPSRGGCRIIAWRCDGAWHTDRVAHFSGLVPIDRLRRRRFAPRFGFQGYLPDSHREDRSLASGRDHATPVVLAWLAPV